MRPGSLWPADRDESGPFVKELECVNILPCNAKDQTPFGTKSDHGLSQLCYGLRRYIPGVASVTLCCFPVRPGKPR